jgi:H+/Cl- antiporter ClcA
MILALIIVASVLVYSVIGMWAFGFCAVRSAGNYNLKHGYECRSADFYYDEPGPWFAAIVWPVYLLFAFALKYAYIFMWHHGEVQAEKMIEARKVRIELQKKIRVEQEKAEREAHEEIEEALRREESAA